MGGKIVTQEQWENRLLARGIMLNSEFPGNNKTPTSLLCLSCRHTWSTTLGSIANGTGCPSCGHKVSTEKQRPSIDFCRSQMSKINIQIMTDRIENSYTPIPVRCLVCGYEWMKRMRRFNKPSGCPKCSIVRTNKNKELPTETYTDRLFSNHIMIISDGVTGPKSSVIMKCIDCGHDWYGKISTFSIPARKCPLCHPSLGEKIIDRTLKTNGFTFTKQKRFSTCRNKKPLPFDFFIEPLMTLIEYQGEQHKKPVSFFGGQRKFETLAKNDRIKRQWAERNGYKLILIHHTVTDIPSALIRIIDRITNGCNINLYICH